MNSPIQASTTTIFRTIFLGLDEETLNQLRHLVNAQTYPIKTTLCRQGAIENTFYIVVKGRVVVSQKLENGQSRILGVCGPRQFFGEMGLLDNTPRIATCTTVIETTVLEITEQLFKQIVENSPAVAYALMYRLLEHLRANDTLAIHELTENNNQLVAAYNRLKETQLAIIKQERLEREHEIAAEVQRSLIPQTLPQFNGYQLAAHLQIASPTSGNFYDVIQIDNEHIGILFGNVADNGVHASLFMAVTRTLFSAESKRTHSPTAVVQAVQNGMIDISATKDIFATAFYGVLHLPTGKLTYVIAGQLPPILYQPTHTQTHPTPLKGNGRFLGLHTTGNTTPPRWEEQHITLTTSHQLICYSNGVINAINPHGRVYTTARLNQAITQNHTPNAPHLIQTILTDVQTWRQDEPSDNDIALLAITVNPDN